MTVVSCVSTNRGLGSLWCLVTTVGAQSCLCGELAVFVGYYTTRLRKDRTLLVRETSLFFLFSVPSCPVDGKNGSRGLVAGL